MPTIGFTMAVSAGADGKLHADVSPPNDDERFSLCSATLVLRIWRESPGIVRCSVYHPASGTTAYVQGNGNLTQLAEALRLELRSE